MGDERMTADEHRARLARYGFECEGGTLENAVDYQRLLADYERLEADLYAAVQMREHVERVATADRTFALNRALWHEPEAGDFLGRGVPLLALAVIERLRADVQTFAEEHDRALGDVDALRDRAAELEARCGVLAGALSASERDAALWRSVCDLARTSPALTVAFAVGAVAPGAAGDAGGRVDGGAAGGGTEAPTDPSGRTGGGDGA